MKILLLLGIATINSFAHADIARACDFSKVNTEKTLSQEFTDYAGQAALSACTDAGFANCRITHTFRNPVYGYAHLECSDANLGFGICNFFVRGEKVVPLSRAEVRAAICNVAEVCELALMLESSETSRNTMSTVARVDGQYDCGLGF